MVLVTSGAASAAGAISSINTSDETKTGVGVRSTLPSAIDEAASGKTGCFVAGEADELAPG